MIERTGDADPISRRVAAEVGEAYLKASSTPADGLVEAAYKSLEVQTDHLFGAFARVAARNLIRIVFTKRPWPYESDYDMIASARGSRILEITTVSVGDEPIHPLFDCAFGGTFDRFRAVHDLVGHVWTGYDFGLQDEFAAWRLQDSLHTGLARLALATELLAINSARFILGVPPQQKAVLLDVGVIARARAGIPAGHRICATNQRVRR
ncbi:MAG: hypothetical protein JWM76_611 [Pseudonocardiales bacterium]|nr:hypothetical protein [Pseudonocardiales bacterium]